MKQAERYLILIIALISQHLTAFSQDEKYVKKNLVFKDSLTKTAHPKPPQQPARLASPFSPSPSTSLPMGFFCRQEYKLEKALKVPVKIRLGTYDVAHRLEYGK